MKERTVHYECEDCGATWPGYDTLPQTGHAIAKQHRVYKITTEPFLDGTKTGYR